MFVDVRHFRMHFGPRTVIEDLSFGIAPGETFGLLGSNGSGKTTTLRALLGMLTPTAGDLLIDGQRFQPAGDSRIGYLPEERGLYRKEPVRDVMSYFGQLKGLSPADAGRWSREYLDRVGLADKARSRIDKLSGGQQQKVQLGIAIMGEPELLILDEPAKGLDPVNRQLLMEMVAQRRDGGATIILVTHHMDEVERLCDRALLLRNGRAEAYGTVNDIQAEYGTRTIRIRANNPIPDSPLYVARLTSGNEWELSPAVGIEDEQILAALVSLGARPVMFEPNATSLQDIFVRIYGSPAAEVAA